MIKVGTLFARRYGIIEKIGTGGMADVYKAQDTKLNRLVAIKVLKADLAADTEFVRRFESEGQAAASLDNANIIGIYDVGTEGTTHYIVMELINGITLKEYIRRKGMLTPRETMAISAQVAVGLRAAHARGIVHRDIKPQNIILSREGKVKVTDFGIARAITDETKTVNKNTMGSVHYIAPEQAKGQLCDERSDIYSLGICMYEMITGQVPFDKDTSIAVALAHMNETMVPPSDVNPDCPTALEQIIFRCTQKSRERRYHNCTELLQDLKIAVASPDFNFEKKEQENLLKSDTLVFSPEEVESIRRGGTAATTVIDGTEKVNVSNGTSSIRKVDYEDFDGEDDEEDEEDAFKEDRKEDEKSVFDRIILILGIVLGAVIVSLIIYLIATLSGCTQHSEEKTTAASEVTAETTTEETVSVETKASEDFDPDTDAKVPDLLGHSLKKATEALLEAGLQYKVSSEIMYSDEYKVGTICKQSYPGGTIVPKDSVIVIQISAGSDKFEVKEEYIGDTVQKFKNAISNFLDIITVNYVRVYSDTVAANKIISLDPSSGYLQQGDTITVTYSGGPENVTVPNLVGIEKSLVSTTLSNNGLYLGSMTEDYDDNVAAGLVCRQQYPAGTVLKNGASVDVVISLGKQELTVPDDLLGMKKDEAVDELTEMGFVVEVTEAYSEDYKIGTVCAVDPEPGTALEKGATVTITVSAEKEKVEIPEIIGSGEAEAVQALQDLGLVADVQYDDTTDEAKAELNGCVEAVSPKVGKKVEAGSTVTVKVVRFLIEVPNLIGCSKKEAKTALENLGLKFGLGDTITTEDANLNNKVGAQDIAAGTGVAAGTKITVNLCTYTAKTVKVTKNCKGMTLEEATAYFNGLGITITVSPVRWEDIETENESEDGKTTVTGQSAAKGDTIAEGSTVEIYYSVYKYTAPTDSDSDNNGDE